MPIHKVSGGYKYGTHGHVYPNREGAVKQAIAIHASGYKEVEHDHKMKAIKRAHQMLASKH